MAKQSFISHVVNGYSRYDVPESKAFTCTPGILYPVRIDFINARDRVTIAQGIDVRSNPLAVPTFNPYTVRLHRFWVPLQLYHPEMRTNSSKFDFNNLSLNWIPTAYRSASSTPQPFGRNYSFGNSLMHWLRLNQSQTSAVVTSVPTSVALSSSQASDLASWSVADTYLAYWDIIRNYYSYSQWSIYSYAWPASWGLNRTGDSQSFAFFYSPSQCYFTQSYGNLEYLDSYFESQFYPASVSSTNGTFNRSNLFSHIINSDIINKSPFGPASDGFPVSNIYADTRNISSDAGPDTQLSISAGTASLRLIDVFQYAHPMAVVPSNPDRFSRLLPPTSSDSTVSMAGVTTIPQLAIASRLQEYKDLLGAGGNRYSDWLETFFASKIDHVDRPKLLFSASQTVNVQVVMNQAGDSGFSGSQPLGQQGGSIAFNVQLGRSQSYYFAEPGYMIDMLSIRPVYYWAGVRPDYANYQGSDYFNPIYNDIGYQSVPGVRIFSSTSSLPASLTYAQEPCFNEFRSSYDEVLGDISYYGRGSVDSVQSLYSYWVQQRSPALLDLSTEVVSNAHTLLFVDMSQVNSPFASTVEDNFFVNMSYSVRKKNLVNKTFATRLSNR